jgi:oligosaccharide repeat unit polymerase
VFIHGFITVSKSVFVDFFILSLVVLYLKKKVKLKTLIIVGGCLVALLLSIQTLRHGGNFSNIEERYGFITLYLSSSMSAFDVVEPMSSEHIGENTFRILYYIAEKLGISSIEPINPILPFIKEPIVTNTYTIMYPFYRDFGAIAVFIFSCIYGLFFGYIYNKMEVNNRSNWYLILYVTFFTYLFYQYSSECILTNLYPTLVRLVLLYLPFWCAKYFTIKKGKCYT